MHRRAPASSFRTRTLGTLLAAAGGLVLAHQGLSFAAERPFTGVVQSCALIYEQGYSAASLPPEPGRHGYRCSVLPDRAGARTATVDVIYDARDPIAESLQPGMSVRIIGAQLGPWSQFRPQGYARNDSVLGISVVLLASGIALWCWGRHAI